LPGETTTVPEVTTTLPGDTTTTGVEGTGGGNTTTTKPADTTTTDIASGGPTTTAESAAGGPTTTAPSPGLPSTGFGGQLLLFAGLALLAIGLMFLVMTRRPDEA
jgi:LPXTG-motif cell wall-anchored protein